MNYKKIYNNLITSRKEMQRNKKQGIYFENHHILPVSFGGTDEKFNLVLLTAKEHWLAHLLLTKIAKGQQKYSANQALVNMGRVISVRKRKTSKLYENARKEIAKNVSKRHKGTLIVKDKKTNILIGRVNKNHPKVIKGEWIFFHKGMKRTEERKLKQSKAVTGKKNPRYSNITNEQIISICYEIFEKYGRWNWAFTYRYAKKIYNLDLPKTLNNKFREPVNSENIEKLMIKKYNIKNLDLFNKYKMGKIEI